MNTRNAHATNQGGHDSQPATAAALADLMREAVTADAQRIRAAIDVLRGAGATTQVAAPPVEPLLTLDATAKALNLHPTTLWRWRAPGHRLAGRPRYRISEVEAYLASPEFHRRAEELREARMTRRDGGARRSGDPA